MEDEASGSRRARRRTSVPFTARRRIARCSVHPFTTDVSLFSAVSQHSLARSTSQSRDSAFCRILAEASEQPERSAAVGKSPSPAHHCSPHRAGPGVVGSMTLPDVQSLHSRINLLGGGVEGVTTASDGGHERTRTAHGRWRMWNSAPQRASRRWWSGATPSRRARTCREEPGYVVRSRTTAAWRCRWEPVK